MFFCLQLQPLFLTPCNDLHLNLLKKDEQLMTHIDLSDSRVYLTREASQAVEMCRDQKDDLVHCENANLPVIPGFLCTLYSNLCST